MEKERTRQPVVGGVVAIADRIEIEPAALPIRLVREGRLLVAVPETEAEQLTAETVEATRRALARECRPRT